MFYDYLHRTMFGFTSGMRGLVVMPVVGDWTVPPERSGSVHDKSKEKATAGYYLNPAHSGPLECQRSLC